MIYGSPTTIFYIDDAEGPTGVEADTFEGAKLACLTLAREGYEFPFSIIPEGERFPILTLAGFGNLGTGEWHGGDTCRRYDGRAA